MIGIPANTSPNHTMGDEAGKLSLQRGLPGVGHNGLAKRIFKDSEIE